MHSNKNIKRGLILVVLLLAIPISGCGYKGPLYLPAEPDSELTQPPSVSNNELDNNETNN